MSTEVSGKLDEIQQHLEGIYSELQGLAPIPADALTYSEVKMQLMVNYVANLSFYLALKQKGEPVADHPVFKHLAFLRTFMERLVPLDATLKYQIDKLLLQSTASDTEEAEATAAAPNLAAFVPSVTSAVKRITVDQVNKASNVDVSAAMVSGGRMEIDPSMIAAQIQRAQQQAASASEKKRKVTTYVEKDSDDEAVDEGTDDGEDFFQEEEMKAKKPRKVSKKEIKKEGKKGNKKVVDDEDDEEIDSDFEL